MNKIESFRLRQNWLRLHAGGILSVLSVMMVAVLVISALSPWWVRPRPTSAQPAATIAEQRSADGRVVCFSDGRAISCLPVWLLDRPNNWVVAYPKSSPTGKMKK